MPLLGAVDGTGLSHMCEISRMEILTVLANLCGRQDA